MFKEKANRFLESHIRDPRVKPYQEAGPWPEATSEECLVAGEKASLTVFRQNSPYKLEGKVLVTVQVAKPVMLGMGSAHFERGLVFSPNEESREATENELQNTGG